MSDEETYIVKQRDLGDIIRMQNEGAIDEFMKDPLAVVCAAVNELLLHPSTFASTGIRVAHAALKGKMFQRLANEVKYWREKGKLPADFAEKKHGYNTWIDLLKIIDDECPDEDRLEALKAMFYAANAVSMVDGDRIVAYELFQIAKTLSSNELLVLNVLWEMTQKGWTTHQANVNVFCEHATKILGHQQTELIMLGYAQLPIKKLAENYSLTALGRKFCENIQTYRMESKGV